MGIFSRFESHMEDGLEGAANKIFDAPLSPVQISKKAERAMRRGKMVGAGKQYAPTLYTVLVNERDDARLFGYYPTLAGETETYLKARAAEEGLSMDGNPLVRFVVDPDLRKGKFDVIAEAVSAPMIAKLRQEEMRRYGLMPKAGGQTPAPHFGQRPASAQQRPTPAARAPQNQHFNVSHPAPQAAGSNAANTPHQAGHPAGGAGVPGTANPAAVPGTYPAAASAAAAGAARTPGAPIHPGTLNEDAPMPIGAEPLGYQAAAHRHDPRADAALPGVSSQISAVRPRIHEPLPYVPESEIDRSIDYGEYTFQSQDFDGGNAARVSQDFSGLDVEARPVNSMDFDNLPQSMQDSVQAAREETYTRTFTTARLVNRITGATYTLTATPLTIGRSSSCTITVDDINASRTHAEIRLDDDGEWVLSDMGSTNGTFVNGEPIETVLLFEGDCITVGVTDFLFSLH